MLDGADAQTALDFAVVADRLGCHRIWFAEHHGAPGLASSAPEILTACALARTRRIRVGAGGVLLWHYSPVKVAEAVGLLSALARGHMDLGRVDLGRVDLGRVERGDLSLGRVGQELQPGPASRSRPALSDRGGVSGGDARPLGQLGR